MAETTLLSVDGLSAGYAETPIIVGVSFDLRRGSITTVIGGNGAGKSTLLRAIYGLNRQFDGDIRLEGRSLSGYDPAMRLSAGIGLVSQGRCNFPRLSVRENLELGAHSLSPRRVPAAIDRVVALFPMLGRKFGTMAGNLSGGEQQILETAMVLEVEPKLLLLDEPSLGLSPLMLGAAATNALLDAMASEAAAVVRTAAFGGALQERRTVFVRYAGQGYELGIDSPVRAYTPDDAALLHRMFEDRYRALYSWTVPATGIEVLGWSVVVSTPLPAPPPPPQAPPYSATQRGTQAVYDAQTGGRMTVPVFWRPDLRPGAVIPGPALIAEPETTTWVSAAFTAHLDARGYIVCDRNPVLATSPELVSQEVA